jgi:hypothetical protein
MWAFFNIQFMGLKKSKNFFNILIMILIFKKELYIYPSSFMKFFSYFINIGGYLFINFQKSKPTSLK